MSSSSPSLWQNPSMVPSPVPEEGLGGMQGVVHMSTNLVRGRRALRGRDVFRFRSEIASTGNRYRQLPKTKHQEVCHINPRSPISHQYTVSCHSTLDASIPRIFNLQPGAQRHPSPSTASTPVTLSGGRASSGAPPGAGPDQAGKLRYDSLASSDRQHLLVLHFHALCKPYVDDNTQPFAGSTPSHGGCRRQH